MSAARAGATLELLAGERGDRAAAAVLRPLLASIRAHLEGALAGEDPEELHDLRVAVRRTRAVQRQLEKVFPRKRIAWFRDEFRWLQRATGEARDLDVHALGFDELAAIVSAPRRPALEPVREALHARRLRARAQMERELRSPRCEMLLERWEALLDQLAESERPRGAVPIGKLADKRIRQLFASVRKRGKAIGPSSPAADYHELRKQGKELRYMLELFAARLHPEEEVAPLVRALKRLQSVLGRHQDREVQLETLRSLRGEVSDPATIVALEELLDRLREDELAARAEFAERFAAFAAGPRRRAVARVFG